uniref:Uncharacterized protein n=1 Tax=Peronospora matthiolae TaxID=2874970 RepID=A0AAV1VEW1_9STRA
MDETGRALSGSKQEINEGSIPSPKVAPVEHRLVLLTFYWTVQRAPRQRASWLVSVVKRWLLSSSERELAYRSAK